MSSRVRVVASLVVLGALTAGWTRHSSERVDRAAVALLRGWFSSMNARAP